MKTISSYVMSRFWTIEDYNKEIKELETQRGAVIKAIAEHEGLREREVTNWYMEWQSDKVSNAI